MTVPQEMGISQAASGVNQDENPQRRLLLVTAGLHGNQAESGHINVVMDFLIKKGWRVDAYIMNYFEESRQAGQLAEAGLFSKLTNGLTSMRNLARAIPRYATVHLFFLSEMSFFRQIAPALLLGRFFGKKVVLSYRRNQAEAELERTGRCLLPLFRICDTILVSSSYLAEVFSRYNVTVEVVPDGVDTDLFRPRTIDSVQPKIIVARSLERRNNISCVIEAFKLVKQKYPRAEMAIAGDGSQREELQRLVTREKLNGVTFTGSISPQQIARRFAEADVYVNTSTIDGLPTSLLEALAVGLPVLTTGVGGIPAVITDRVNGLFVRSNDPAGLADRIIELVESPELVHKLSEQAKLSARDYLWPHVKDKWVDLYRRLERF